MAEFPALPLWTDAYLADTRHLSAREHGAYLLLLMEAWRRPRCRLPDNDDLLARLACCSSAEWAEIKPAVMAFWTIDARACEWTQKRLLKEREYVEKIRAQKRGAARTRWKTKKNEHANGSLPHMQKASPAYAPTPTPIKKESETPSGVSSQSSLCNGSPAEAVPLETVVSIWLEECRHIAWKPQDVKHWTDTRRKTTAGRFAKFFHGDLDEWRAFCRRIAASEFLSGRSCGFKCTIDWALKPENHTKIIEGNYDGRAGTGTGQKRPPMYGML